jgi:Na+-transporting NADH:ubiquinone oxidoreductase subunit C
MAETAGRTIAVATVLCGVCSVLVAGAVMVLKPKQDINKELDFKKNILQSAGLLSPGTDINDAFKQIEPVVVDLGTGNVVQDIDVSKFNQDKADKDPQYVESLGKLEDVAGIKRRSKIQKVFLVKKDGHIDQIILHVYGKGLWSTMKGFLALDKDGNTVKGFNYYSHGETPGLGGEVDNPKWIAQWAGKKMFDENDEFHPKTKVVKGVVNPSNPQAAYMIDGLSGATLTSVGIENTFKFWMSDLGYGKFLTKVRSGEIQ